MTRKKLLILLLIIVALYIAGTWMGLSRKDDPNAKLKTDWVGTIKEMVVGREPHVAQGDLVGVAPADAACLSGGAITLTMGRKCTFKVPESGISVRTLQLHLVSVGKADVHWQADGSPPVKMDVPMKNGDIAKLTVTKTGGTLTVEAGDTAAPPGEKLKLE